MKLPASQARAISRGKKTELRVPVDPRLIGPLRPARRHGGRPNTYSIDDIITIRSETDPVHAKVIDLDRGPLGTLTDIQALAEGHPTVQEFEIAFVERHEHGWLNRQVEYLVEQGIPRQEADETRDSWAKVRYDQIWATREVWVLTLKPFDDMPYLLPGLVDEPEGIPVDRLKQRWTTKAERRLQTAKVEVLEDKLAACTTVEERIAVIRREAHSQGRDIRTHLRAIDRRLEDLVKLLQTDKAA
jgi:hypothetical protein